MNQETQKQIIPWSQRKEIGFFKALWETIKQILCKPGEFFSNLETNSYSEPFLFCFIVFTITMEIFWMEYVFLFKKPEVAQIPIFFLLLIMLIIIIISIIATIIALYGESAIMHLFVLLFRGKGGFKGTFNVCAYASAATIFTIIPLIGGYIYAIWAIIVGVIGFKIIHKFGTVRAIGAYFGLPLIIALSATIAITIANPNLLRARRQVNESYAQATLRTISTAIENYYAANERYPSGEYDLKYAHPPYLTRPYHNETIFGYKYSLNFTEAGYEVIAAPSKCGITGRKNFKIVTGGFISEEDCR